MQSYVNLLNPTGSTYHDNGMRWGVRMLSSGGIFADSPDTFAAVPVSRNIIFLTDGQMDTVSGVYGAYQHREERHAGQRHVRPVGKQLNGRHNTTSDDVQRQEHEHLDLGDRARHRPQQRHGGLRQQHSRPFIANRDS